MPPIADDRHTTARRAALARRAAAPLAAVVAVALGAAPGAAQRPSPGPRAGAYMAYDAARRQSLLFGGWTRGASGAMEYPDDLWAWDGTRWRLLAPPPNEPRPVGRDVPVVAYDARRERLIVVGGRRPATGDANALRDVWEWDGTRWHRVTGTGLPHLLHPTATYDPSRGRVVLFGGGVVDGEGRFARLSRTSWEWDGARWSPIDSAGPADRTHGGSVATRDGIVVMTDHPGDNRDSARVASATWAWADGAWRRREDGPAFNNLQAVAGAPDGTLYVYQSWEAWLTAPVLHVRTADGRWRRVDATPNPGVRNTSAAAWDAARGRLVVYGGQTRAGTLLDDTWEFDGRAWARRGPPAPPAAVPPALHWEALALDDARDRIVLFGGVTGDGGYLAGTWAWRGGRWAVVADSASGPAARHAHAMAYDPAGRRVVLYGGVTEPRGGPARPHCDTWALDDAGWRRLADARCDDARGPARSAAATLVHDATTRTLVLLEGPPSPPADTAPRPLRLWRLRGGGGAAPGAARWVLADSAGPRRTGAGGAAWDARRGVLVVPVLDGPDAGVWEWDGRRWVRLAVAGAAGPVGRRAFAVAYAPHLGAVVVAGGRAVADRSALADAWTWDGRAWAPLPDTAAPAARSHATLLADPARGRLGYFGGAGERGLLRELWWRGPGGWRAEPAPEGAGPAGR